MIFHLNLKAQKETNKLWEQLRMVFLFALFVYDCRCHWDLGLVALLVTDTCLCLLHLDLKGSSTKILIGLFRLSHSQEPSQGPSLVPFLGKEPSPVPFLVLFRSKEPSLLHFTVYFWKSNNCPTVPFLDYISWFSSNRPTGPIGSSSWIVCLCVYMSPFHVVDFEAYFVPTSRS